MLRMAPPAAAATAAYTAARHALGSAMNTSIRDLAVSVVPASLNPAFIRNQAPGAAAADDLAAAQQLHPGSQLLQIGLDLVLPPLIYE